MCFFLDYLIKEESDGFIELFKDLLQSWVVLSKDNGHKIHLPVHLSFGFFNYILFMVLIGFEPSHKKSVARGLLTVFCFCDVKHNIVVLLEELFDNSYQCLPEFFITR